MAEKPKDIPQEIWERAESVIEYGQTVNPGQVMDHQLMMELVARGIMSGMRMAYTDAAQALLDYARNPQSVAGAFARSFQRKAE